MSETTSTNPMNLHYGVKPIFKVQFPFYLAPATCHILKLEVDTIEKGV